MESNYIIELQDGIEVYYPLGINVLGAATAVVLMSPEAKRSARRAMRWVFYLGWAFVVTTIASIRLLGVGFFAIPIDLASFALHSLIAKHAATRFGPILPPHLARKLCAEAVGDRLDERTLQAWMMLFMLLGGSVMMFFGNVPAFWTFGVTSVLCGIHAVIQMHRLRTAALE